MEAKLFIAGILIGFLVSLPVGPMGIYVVRKTMNHGRWAGFRSGLGITTADLIFASVAAIGLSVVIAFIDERKLLFQISGGLVVLALGLKIFFTSPRKLVRSNRNKKGPKLFEDYFSVLLLTLSNPLTILFYLALFASLKSSDQWNFFQGPVLLILGIGLGASGWWLFLTSLLSRFRKKIRFQKIFWFNKLAGALIMIFGLVVLGTLFFPF
ncbi:MAG: LysE family translocator [Chlorobi bacterium]|nr:LysE family translocator [Chlorobiota bacterium]